MVEYNKGVYTEEGNGQFVMNFSTEVQDEFVLFIKHGLQDMFAIITKINCPYTVEIHQEYEQVMKAFISSFFKRLSFFPSFVVCKIFEENKSLHHALGKVFLFYLHTFIYKEKTIKYLHEPFYMQLKSFILEDTYSRAPYKNMVEEIYLRKQLR